MTKPFFPREVIEYCAAIYGLTPAQLTSVRKTTRHLRARWVAVRIMRERGLSLHHIGKVMHRHHSSILNMLQQHNAHWQDTGTWGMLANAREKFL